MSGVFLVSDWFLHSPLMRKHCIIRDRLSVMFDLSDYSVQH